MSRLLASAATLALLTACGAPASTPGEEATATPLSATAPVEDRKVETTSPDVWGDWGIDLTAMNRNVAPGDDFFRYVNGTWYDQFELPADKVRYGAFDLLREKSEQQIRFIIEDLAKDAPPLDTPAGKVAAMYNAFLDTKAIDAAGLAPLGPLFERIEAIESREALAEVFGSVGFASPIGTYVGTDDKDPDTYILHLYIAGLGLPDREYYLKDDATSEDIRKAYVDYLATLLDAAGEAAPRDAAQRILALETRIAEADWDRALSRNPELTYNKLDAEDRARLAGDFPLDRFLTAAGAPIEGDMLVIEVPPTEADLDAAGLSDADAEKLGPGIGEVMRLAQTAELGTWKVYLKAHLMRSFASVLPREIDEATFAFYGTKLRGQPEQRPRWKRAVSEVENSLGEALGQVYVDRHFPPTHKAEMDDLVANLRAAMRANLQDLAWMSPETRIRAEEKLDRFTPKIGYPPRFETYETMDIGQDAFANALAASRWAWEDNLGKLGSEVDRDEWFMTPQTVNAYYYPPFNEIVFPAAILQPPFFNMSADPAVNYGAIGGVIGHEIGHGFDDQGSKYDGDGVLRNWWTDEDLARFRALGRDLARQYDAYCPLEAEDAPCVNGQLSLGENIGDLGGLSLAYRAYRLSLNGEEAPVIDGLTGDQRFFLAWGQVWRSKSRDEALRQQLLTGPHSPARYRVNGVVRNMDAWYEAFGVEEGNALWLPPEDRVKIW